MLRARKILAIVLWLLYGFAVSAHAAHHILEASQPAGQHFDDGPCMDCAALGALGLLLVAAPRLPAAATQFATYFAPLPAPVAIPRAAPRRIREARGPPPRKPLNP